MTTGRIEGFEQRRLQGEGIEVDAMVGGSGPPLLLLHGYPQTRMCWAGVAAALAGRFTVVVPDLRGYGRSGKPQGGGDRAAHSKRAMAADQVAAMGALGFERFDVAGHDRGGRVAYRLALDHPHAVRRLCVLDIVPTGVVWAGLDADKAVGMWHWSFLVQEDLPERLIGADPDAFLRWSLRKMAADGFEFPAGSMADYLACIRDPAVVHGVCEDYRAGYGVDRAHDEADRAAARRIAAPLLVLWGAEGTAAKSDPLGKWRGWADAVQGRELPGGHFVPEEATVQVVAALSAFLA